MSLHSGSCVVDLGGAEHEVCRVQLRASSPSACRCLMDLLRILPILHLNKFNGGVHRGVLPRSNPSGKLEEG